MSPALISGARLAHVGILTATSRGTTVAAHASTNTKGNYVELSSSTPMAADGFYVVIGGGGSSVGAQLLDIAIGAASSEQVIVPNIAFGNLNLRHTYCLYFPVPIPAGTRLSARTQSAVSAQNVSVSVMLAKGGLLVPGSLGRCVDIGTNTSASRGTNVDPGGSANTKPGYVQITAATTAPIKALLVMAVNGTATNDRVTDADWLFDIAIGAGGSEQIIAPNIHVAMDNGGTGVAGISQPPFWLPVEIPTGSRIAVNPQSDNNTDTDENRDFYLSFIGVG
jgi:hypothetical protein